MRARVRRVALPPRLYALFALTWQLVLHDDAAWALLFPIDWPESFGLVVIEATAPCWTLRLICEFERRLIARHMAEDHVVLYERLVRARLPSCCGS